MSQDDDIIIFATDANLQILSQSSALFMDGTFKAAPRLFTQLFTIHTVYRDHFVPLVYCLLPNKQRTTYYAALETIKRKMADIHLLFNPDSVMSDFELGLINALEMIFPNASLEGCYFHFTQCIWRRVQQSHLITSFRDDDVVRSLVRRLMAVAFLPIVAIRPSFVSLQQEAETLNNANCNELLDYFQGTWLNGQFPLQLWNVHNRSTRTNNHIEGWHSKLNKSCRKLHPSVHELVTVLQVEQGETELTLRRARLGAAPAPRRRKYRQCDERLDRLREQYTSGTLNSMDYINSISQLR